MEAVPGMHLEQSEEDLSLRDCKKAAISFYPSWEDHWSIDDLEDSDLSYKVFCNKDIRVQTFLETDRFLAAIQDNGRVTLLFTVWSKQKFPLCSNVNCSKQSKCICYKRFKKILDDEENEGDATYYWNRRTCATPAAIEHFLKNLPTDQHHRKHGFNKTKIEYPIKRCPVMQQKFLHRLEGVFNLPEKIMAKWNPQSTCNHGNVYTEDDEKQTMMSPNLTIYTETSDRVFAIPTYGRPTQDRCNCFDQEDTHDLLLWNLGSGKLVDYLFLHNYFHRMVTSGMAMNACCNSRKSSLSDIGLTTSLTYQQFVRACTGYAQMIGFRKEDFLCSSCKDNPKYLVCDGKTDGPTKRKVEHLHELDTPEHDESPLCQGSLFEDRVFLSEKSERTLVCQLLTDSLSAQDFTDLDTITSQNGKLVVDLVEWISASWPDEIPQPYKRFLGNICKLSSVAGFLQVLSSEPLDYLQQFCLQSLDVRSAGHSDKQKQLAQEMPALWPNLVDILNLEGTNYLPEAVSDIILKLVEIRKKTFQNAAVRNTEDYIYWENPEDEHPTQFYPNWKIWRFPKKYVVRNVSDCEFCEKNFNKHTDFSYGVFSVGCACPLNITYGYELMLCKESAHNLFRLLMCRDVDLNALQGVIFDHACGLDQYILNREPKEFEYLRCLVDGAHWQVGQSLKKPAGFAF